VHDRISYTDRVVNFTEVVNHHRYDGSDMTQDVDVLVWWRDVGQVRFPRITVMDRQFLDICETSATVERVLSCAGLTLSDLCKSLLEGTLETIMWSKCSLLLTGLTLSLIGFVSEFQNCCPYWVSWYDNKQLSECQRNYVSNDLLGAHFYRISGSDWCSGRFRPLNPFTG
jgi:hypothetical protein